MVKFHGMATPSIFNRRSHARFWWRTSTTFWSSLLSTEEACPWPLAVFYCFGSFWQTTSATSATSFSFLFFFRLGRGSRLTVGGGGGEGGGGGRARRGWDPKVSFYVDPLALSARSSHKPFFLFRAISSSSFELLSTLATMNLGGMNDGGPVKLTLQV